MDVRKEPYLIKVVIVGDGGVGKTSLRRAYLGNSFRYNYIPTIGADFGLKTWSSEKSNLKIMFWDISGEIQFSKVRPEYYDNAISAILVYDVLRHETFMNLEKWLAELHKFAKKTLKTILILGNKVDLLDNQGINVDENDALLRCKEIMKPYGNLTFLDHYYTSALSGKNVVDAFSKIALSVEEGILKEGTKYLTGETNAQDEE